MKKNKNLIKKGVTHPSLKKFSDPATGNIVAFQGDILKVKAKLNSTQLRVEEAEQKDFVGGEDLLPSVGLGMIIPRIFKSKMNSNSKLRPFNKIISDVGDIQYFPAWSKEWRNSVYHFNSNLIKNFPAYDINIVKLIKAYFSIYFNHQFLNYRYIQSKKRILSFNKIFFARPEIKHTNSKAIVTLYTYNREKIALLYKLARVSILSWKLLCFLKEGKGISSVTYWKTFKSRKLNPKWDDWEKKWGKYNIPSELKKKKWLWYKKKIQVTEYSRYMGFLKKIERIFFRLNMIFFIIKDKNLLQDFYGYLIVLKRCKIKAKQQANKWAKLVFKRELILLRKLKFKLNLNKYKFQEKFLCGLRNLISNIYNKQIEFNIVNLKNIIFNTDLFTEISTKKIKKRNSRVLKIMHIMLNKAKLPRVNRIKEKGRIVKTVNYDLIENKYRSLNLKDILSGELNLDNLLNSLYFNVNEKILPKVQAKLYNIIFNSIKYKNMAGIRMEVKGRLTPRYRADRSVYKLRWKGGLKNIDSSYKGLSVRKNRGHLNPNVSYSIFSSKRRVGAFAVKGWMAGK